MSRPSNDDRRTMPPLPAAGGPLAPHEPANEERSRPGVSKLPPQAATGVPPLGTATVGTVAGVSDATSKSNPLNMALLELQEELEVPAGPTPTPPPAQPEPTPAPAPEPAAPQEPAAARPEPVAPAAAVEPPQPQPVAPGPPPVEPPPVAPAFASDPVAAPRPATAAASSTPPIAGVLERPAERRPQDASAHPQPVEAGPPLTPILLGGAAVWFLFGVLGAWAYSHFTATPSSEADREPAVAAPTNDAPAPALSLADLEPLKTRLGALGQQIDDVEKQLAEAPKPAPAVDLAPIRQRIDDVAKSVDTIDPLSKQLQGLGSRLEGIETAMTGLKGELSGLQAKAVEPAKPSDLPPSSVPTGVPAAATATATPAEPLSLDPAPAQPARPTQEAVKETGDANAPVDQAALAQGIAFLNTGKYDDAYKLFEKLGAAHPNDARVWYFAALSYGWAHDDFKTGSKTFALFQKGVEREKAGSPNASEIEKAFDELSSDGGKLWLKFKREENFK